MLTRGNYIAAVLVTLSAQTLGAGNTGRFLFGLLNIYDIIIKTAINIKNDYIKTSYLFFGVEGCGCGGFVGLGGGGAVKLRSSNTILRSVTGWGLLFFVSVKMVTPLKLW